MATYIQIATVTVTAGGGQAAIDFTAIPGTYTDLLIKLSARSTSTSIGVVVKPNGSTSSITTRNLEGAGSGTPISYTSTNIAGYIVPSTATASTFGNTEIYIPNYAGSTNKTISSDSVTENNATAAYGLLTAWLWSNTAAITSITLSSDSGTNNFAQHTTATLYGISNS
jgi:hypothetical protein